VLLLNLEGPLSSQAFCAGWRGCQQGSVIAAYRIRPRPKGLHRTSPSALRKSDRLVNSNRPGAV